MPRVESGSAYMCASRVRNEPSHNKIAHATENYAFNVHFLAFMHHIFFFNKSSLSTRCHFKHDLLAVTISPAVENTRPLGTLVAGIDKSDFATVDNSGNCSSCNRHPMQRILIQFNVIKHVVLFHFSLRCSGSRVYSDCIIIGIMTFQ